MWWSSTGRASNAFPGTVEVYQSALALAEGDLDGTVGHARKALSLSPPDDHLTRASAAALSGLASWTTGDLDAAHDGYAECIAGLLRVGFVSDVLGCSVTVGDIRRTQGGSGRRCRRTSGRWSSQPWNPAHRRCGEPPTCTSAWPSSCSTATIVRPPPSTWPEATSSGSTTGCRRTPTARASRWPGYARPKATSTRLSRCWTRRTAFTTATTRRTCGRSRRSGHDCGVRRGELTDALAWARERQLTAGDDLSYLREYEHVTLARLLLARHAAERADTCLEEASGLLGRLLTAAELGERTSTVIEILVLQALAEQARGDTAAALAPLQRAVTLAEPEGHVRVFADEGPPMAALLKALAKKKATTPGYLRRLLAATAGTAHAASVTQALVEPLSERELDVLRLLGSDLDGPDIARELSVSLNTMRTHTKNIYAKLGVTSRREAVRQAHQLNLL